MLKQLDTLPQVLKQVVKKLVSAKSTRQVSQATKIFLRDKKHPWDLSDLDFICVVTFSPFVRRMTCQREVLDWTRANVTQTLPFGKSSLSAVCLVSVIVFLVLTLMGILPRNVLWMFCRLKMFCFWELRREFVNSSSDKCLLPQVCGEKADEVKMPRRK